MRLFVAAWPSEDVRRHLRAIRPSAVEVGDGVRWTPEERWHVTLRFLGEVDDAVPVVEALAASVGSSAPPTAVLGDRVERLGSVAVVPVTGLDDLAATVMAATADIGQPPDERPFHGHITVARGRRQGRLPVDLAGLPAAGPGGGRRSWTVGSLAVVRSILGPDHRYEAIAEVALARSGS